MIKRDPGDPFRGISLRSGWNGDLRSEQESAKEPLGRGAAGVESPGQGQPALEALWLGWGEQWRGGDGWQARRWGWGTQEVGPCKGVGSAVGSPGAF